ncbi:hypothetical protein [Blastococcus montanus]|uniref:hypothetical protein n=1 Tax=Blastococcus montanus TaxID=3144973 RepID=UPI00320B4FE1
MVRYTWVPYIAAAAGVALVLKGTLIIASGDTVGDGAMAVLYLGGLALALVTAVGAGLRQPGLLRGLAVGAGSVLLLILWIMGLGDALKPLVGLVSEAEHVQAEVPVVVAGLALLLVALHMRSRDIRRTTEPVTGAGAPAGTAAVNSSGGPDSLEADAPGR